MTNDFPSNFDTLVDQLDHTVKKRESRKRERCRLAGITEALEDATVWLFLRGRDGVFDKRRVLLAQGEKGGFMRETWNRLEALGYGSHYGGRTGRGRFRLTQKGEDYARRTVEEDRR
jgi:hypothetical protein